jgi:hypothetical protein
MQQKLLFTMVLLFALSLANGQSRDTPVAATPPMGWNSYDCYGATVTASEVKANADYVARHLKPFGWNYIVVDFCWYYPEPAGSKVSPPQQKRLQDGSYVPRLAMDKYGRLLPVERKFPASAGGKGFRPLADYVHSLGLRFGIHVMRGIPRQAVQDKTPVLGAKGINAAMIADTASTCSWMNLMYGLDMRKAGAQAYLNSLLQQYASWGVDFIKVDDISRPYHKEEIEGYRRAIENCGRPIVLSLSPGATPLAEARHVMRQANQWRVADDFWDSWKALKPMFALADAWAPYAGPGHWPNLDMIPIGRLSKRGPVGKERYSRFTPEEERTMMTLWCIARSPLILGGNLPENRPEDLALETNPRVLAVNQKGRDEHQLYRKDGKVVWVSRMPGGEWNVAFFNLNDRPDTVDVQFSALGITGRTSVHDLWTGKDLGTFRSGFSRFLPAHGCGLFGLVH